MITASLTMNLTGVKKIMFRNKIFYRLDSKCYKDGNSFVDRLDYEYLHYTQYEMIVVTHNENQVGYKVNFDYTDEVMFVDKAVL